MKADLHAVSYAIDVCVPWRIGELGIMDANDELVIALPKEAEEGAKAIVERINHGQWTNITIEKTGPVEREGVPLYITNLGQKVQEIDALVELAKREKVRGLLEIGSQFGGSLWKLGSSLPEKSLVVSVDRPENEASWNSLKECMIRLSTECGHDTHLFRGDSAGETIVNAVRALGPFDLVHIDGDHALAGVEQDWRNYGLLGRIVAFHDIGWPNGPGMDVPRFWNELKQLYIHQEIRYSLGNSFGIGVLWNEERRSQSTLARVRGAVRHLLGV